MPEFDVIVVGLGGAGSASAYHLSASGYRVLGIEQFGPAHAHGSSHGRTRIFRTAYSEGEVYVPFSQRAQVLWCELQRISGEQILKKTGGLFIGARDSPTVSGALRSAARFSLRHELLLPSQVTQRFPQFALAESEVAVYDPDAGVLFPENCIRAYDSAAVGAGGLLHFGESVRGWSAAQDGVTVRTTAGEYRARSLVLTAGAWTAQLTGGLHLPLVIQRQFVLWFPATSPELVSPSRMPVFIWNRRPEVETYGVPDFGDGVKVGAWAGKASPTPESADRTFGDAEAGPVREFVRSSLRGVGPREKEAGSCLFTMAPDHHFLIGRHPRHSNVVIASACSGHGFKFTSAVGEAISQLVSGTEVGPDLSSFDPARFAGDSSNP